VFSEAFVAGYPLWVWFIPAGHTHPLRELYAEFLANAVAVPSTATALLCEAAKKAGVAVAIGVNEVNSEASCTTIYNTLLYISADGAILGKHRKVMPTGGEKLVWGLGDGSDLEVYDLPFGRLAGCFVGKTTCLWRGMRCRPGARRSLLLPRGTGENPGSRPGATWLRKGDVT